MTRRALVSVSDKSGLVPFVQLLDQMNWTIISTGGTHTALAKAKILNLLKLSDLGISEVMDGRVKTIHPKLAGGILAKRNNPAHMRALEESLQSFPIDLVVVNLYPFAETAEKFEKGKAGFDELIENIDIGGPTLIRAAAKNYQDVLVVVDPADYPEVATQLSGEETVEFRFEMAKKAFGHIAVYDVVIAETLMGVQLS